MNVLAYSLTGMLFVSSTHTAQEASKQPNLGQLTWAAFSCATWAEWSGNSAEQKRLFSIGYASGARLVERVKDGTLTEAERKGLPIGIRGLFGGPSVDFVVGRMFEHVSEYAFDKVVKESNDGAPILDPSKWADDELRNLRAADKFRSSNCALIK